MELNRVVEGFDDVDIGEARGEGVGPGSDMIRTLEPSSSSSDGGSGRSGELSRSNKGGRTVGAEGTVSRSSKISWYLRSGTVTSDLCRAGRSFICIPRTHLSIMNRIKAPNVVFSLETLSPPPRDSAPGGNDTCCKGVPFIPTPPVTWDMAMSAWTSSDRTRTGVMQTERLCESIRFSAGGGNTIL